MDAKEFVRGLKQGLNKLTSDQIEKIRIEYEQEGDYGITEDGRTYWIPSKSDSKSGKKTVDQSSKQR